jgi:hypothetical protein
MLMVKIFSVECDKIKKQVSVINKQDILYFIIFIGNELRIIINTIINVATCF